MKAIYKDVEYFVISTLGDMIELAPTAHGAGSFVVHKDFVVEEAMATPITEKQFQEWIAKTWQECQERAWQRANLYKDTV